MSISDVIMCSLPISSGGISMETNSALIAEKRSYLPVIIYTVYSSYYQKRYRVSCVRPDIINTINVMRVN